MACSYTIHFTWKSGALYKLWKKLNPNSTVEEDTDFIDKYCKKIEKEALTPLFDDMRKQYNTTDEKIMAMDRESISIPFPKTGYSAIWMAKKHYAILLSAMEEVVYAPDYHMKIMGLESVKSTMPTFIKPVYNQIIVDLIIEGPEKARKTFNNFKKEFFTMDLSKIGIPTSVSAIDKFVDRKTKLPYESTWYDPDLKKQRNGGVPINSKACIYYNYLIDKYDLGKKYTKIKDGDKIRWVFLKENIYGFSNIALNPENDDIPPEFKLSRSDVDFNQHFQRMMKKPISDLFEACSLSLENIQNMSAFW